MRILVIGSGCDTCSRLYENTCEALRRLGRAETPEKVEDLVEMVKLGVMQVPALMVDGKLLFAGRVPDVKAICRALEKAAKETPLPDLPVHAILEPTRYEGRSFHESDSGRHETAAERPPLQAGDARAGGSGGHCGGGALGRQRP